MKRIAVVGTGYVGLVSGVCFAEIGHECVCVDIDAAKVARINRGEAPIHEQGLEPMLRRHVGGRLSATTDLGRAVRESDLTFIAVGTPFDGSRIDLGYVREAARQVGAALRDKAAYHAVVVKSTVVPGTTDDVVQPALEAASGKRAGADFGVGMNPEFLTEGVAVDDFMRPDRIVIGGMDERTIGLQRDVYAPFAGVPVIATNNKTAEMIKYASNSVLANLISFSNEFANLCAALGDVDVADVMTGVHAARYFTTTLEDGRRIQAPITSFLWAGCGYGGSCLPKDTKALAAHGAAHGEPMPLLEAVIGINERQPARMIALLQKHFASLAGVRVTVLGLAFKPDTDDVRESPAFPVIRELRTRGARVVGYDPVAGATARAALPADVEVAPSLGAALDGAQAVVIVTAWDEFLAVPELLAGRRERPVVVDGRRMLDARRVGRYEGIGLSLKGAASP
jgi:UDPglucose 6-dehydrogenase/GDP-mannose 6-dehydrogenase